MTFARNNHPTRLFGPTLLFGTWEYAYRMFGIDPYSMLLNYILLTKLEGRKSSIHELIYLAMVIDILLIQAFYSTLYSC